jgi:NADPH:quinone reductase-like Zn-dependent oxidoreductase
MKAIVYERYGPPEVLQIRDIAKPVPRDRDVLVRVRATTVHRGDVRMRIPDPFLARLVNGLLAPKKIPVLGLELAGDVETVGQKVRRFRPGDRVFAFAGFGFGAYAQYKCLPEAPRKSAEKEGMLAHMPANMDYGEAAPLAAGAVTALNVLRTARIEPGQRVLIYGASGSVGTYALQLARANGAEVTGVCSSRNLAMVTSLGAARVIDYTAHDFTFDPDTYDVVFDAVSRLSSAQRKRARSKTKLYLDVDKDSGSGGDLKTEDLDYLRALVEAGKLRSFIDRVYPMEEIVEAHLYVETGRKRGNVVITVD